MPRKKKAKPELKVVFDTSVLYTQVASDLVREAIRKLISENSSHADLNINWYLPSIVISERRYQMQRKAFELLPSIQKLEKLLGHNLNITEEILVHRVNGAIETELDDLGVTVVEIDTNKIDWSGVIERSVNRTPPFQPGDKEKGFRDSLIAEAFIQLVEQSPTTPMVCRLAIVADDKRLEEFVRNETKDSKNVRVLSNIGELESLINTLVSEVTEEFVADVRERAESYLFTKDDKSTLYYKEEVGEKIRQEYSDELKSTPSEGLSREGGTWWIGEPVFVKKERQRIYWATTIKIDAKLFRLEYPEPGAEAEPGSVLPGLEPAQRNVLRGGIGGLLVNVPRKVESGTGQSIFEVHWSVNITQTKKFTSPRIERIEVIGTKWGDE